MIKALENNLIEIKTYTKLNVAELDLILKNIILNDYHFLWSCHGGNITLSVSLKLDVGMGLALATKMQAQEIYVISRHSFKKPVHGSPSSPFPIRQLSF